MTHRIVTLVNALFQGLIAAPQLVAYLNPTIQDKCLDFQIEPVLMHSPLLKESLWVSHPPPTYMLKFSGLADLSSCFKRDDPQVAFPQLPFSLRSRQYKRTSEGTIRPVPRQGEDCTACAREHPGAPWHTTTHYERPWLEGSGHTRRCDSVDTEAGKPSGVTRRRRVHSGPY